MKRLLLIAPVLAVLLFAGCDLFGGSPDYYPLTVGNAWNQRAVSILETTDATPETSLITENRMVIINKDTLNSGLDVFAMAQATTMNFRSPETTYIVFDTTFIHEGDDAVLTFDSKGDTTGDTLLSLPLGVGKTWVQSLAVATVAQQENVTVAAGTYKNCWRIDYKVALQTGLTMHMWYGNKVGAVKTETVIIAANYKSTYISELTSAIIK